ncbi:fructosamine kinase family protein [Flavivirga spongiicola]|uniref:Fructosamine kinase family protein n=1 Tax=Flavivirga spongiicola TaxID=421621 RepID=A0ABU7XQA4_9FLAO|nr:fructosamine kinase family protein [Flavivirga sp. MEBiC05379]MDO5977745.1 fructosamine kinase family protein [Flavivirga sp. MEBiC05379]
MNNDLKIHLSSILKESITRVSPLHGGDISNAYRIETSNNSYFLKLNEAINAAKIFQAEVYGLQLIGETNTIKTPRVLASDTFQNSAFLLMEFIENKSPSSNDFKNLGHQLAQLHKYTSEKFGLDQDNFIGSLPQSNKPNKTWIDFYTTERLLPQLELAKQKHLLSKMECPSVQKIKDVLKSLFKDIKPALLHGDLWSGNYIISKNDVPYLIDPAAHYGHHEVDIAMTKLFGGFNEFFYDAYDSNFTRDKNTSNRIEIYQLYYLLVHLNLFGRSYYGSVSTILKKYF